jgi:hypothetical protein
MEHLDFAGKVTKEKLLTYYNEYMPTMVLLVISVQIFNSLRKLQWLRMPDIGMDSTPEDETSGITQDQKESLE